MENIEKLYDAFGELIYVVAMADGIIQKEEYAVLEDILKGHPWSKEIKWSFDYEKEHNNSIEFLYKKVLDICHEFGPRSEYQFLLQIMEKIANAHEGSNTEEQKVINKFTSDLTSWFRKDLEKLEANN